MNPTEHLVELYYRQKGHFTITDIKVENGNNRQFDILTYDKKSDEFNHIEINVTHSQKWIRPLDSISEEIRFKFFGIPKNKRPNHPATDFARGKTYLDSIKTTYEKFGIDYNSIKRVWCTWCLTQSDIENISDWKNSIAEEFNLNPENFEILLFRDEVLTSLLKNIGTSNYDDALLRTLSLIGEHKKQTEF